MARGLNKVMIIGNLGQDPELKHGKSGTAVANLRVAISDRKKVGDSYEDHTEWVNVTVFGKTAENVATYCTKGSQIYAEGRMQTRSYEKDGVKRYATEVVAYGVTFLGGKGKGEQPASKPAPAAEDEFLLGDSPF